MVRNSWGQQIVQLEKGEKGSIFSYCQQKLKFDQYKMSKKFLSLTEAEQQFKADQVDCYQGHYWIDEEGLSVNTSYYFFLSDSK